MSIAASPIAARSFIPGGTDDVRCMAPDSSRALPPYHEDMNSTFEDSMERLGRDVSFLGRVLGDVLREQGGDELFDAVEGLRVACRHHRQYHCGEAADEVAALVASLPLGRALEVARAFTMY